jgi:hypothetical protein
MKHRHSTPPPHPRASVQHADLAPGLNVVDGVPILRLGRAAFHALDGGRSVLVNDLDGADDVLDIEAAS